MLLQVARLRAHPTRRKDINQNNSGGPPSSGPVKRPGGPTTGGPTPAPSGHSRPGPAPAPGSVPASRPGGGFGGGGARPSGGGFGGGGARPGGFGGGGSRDGGRDNPNRPKREGKDGLRVNREIRAVEVRVIDDEGKMLGVFPVPEALKLAEDRELDLIEIAPTAKPPTCKIMDYGKFKYENKKKEHQARKNQTVITIKEIQLRPRTDQHDLDVKMRHARRFILEGDKVKVNLRFYGREMAHQELGFNLLKKVIASLSDIALVEVNPKMEGRQLFVLVAPDAGKIKDLEKANPELFKKNKTAELPPMKEEKEEPEEADAE
jgi:translation initiation factor IF-3